MTTSESLVTMLGPRCLCPEFLAVVPRSLEAMSGYLALAPKSLVLRLNSPKASLGPSRQGSRPLCPCPSLWQLHPGSYVLAPKSLAPRLESIETRLGSLALVLELLVVELGKPLLLRPGTWWLSIAYITEVVHVTLRK